ncbi:MAG: hypothetical protein H6613_10265 [Ignavibacteriales bacterium]|nr:hypothetical protein [Ignavibacteriales bacterium]
MNSNQFEKAKKSIVECLKLNPNYRNAKQLFNELNKKAD